MDRSFGDPHQVFKFPRFVAIATIHSPGRVRSKTCLFVDELNGPDNEKKKKTRLPTNQTDGRTRPSILITTTL